MTNAKRVLTVVVTIAALAFGGSAVAQAAGPGQQSGAQAAKKHAKKKHAKKKRSVKHKKHGARARRAQTHNGAPGENESATEPNETAGEGSETPGGDGPGGHADEPGNPNADHQNEGVE